MPDARRPIASLPRGSRAHGMRRQKPLGLIDASAQSVGRVALLSRNVCQSNRVLANWIAGHKAERRPGAGEERLAAAKHDGAEVEPILIDETKVGQASRQVRSGDANLPDEPSLDISSRITVSTSFWTRGHWGRLTSTSATRHTSVGFATPLRSRVPPRPTRASPCPNNA